MSVGPAQAKEPKPLPSPPSDEAIERLQAMRPPERFEKNGYACVPHWVLEIGPKVSGHAQHILVEAIMHATFGARGNPVDAPVSLNELGSPRYSRYGRKAFEIALEDGVARGLIRRRKVGRGWNLRVVPEAWKSVPDYVSRKNNNPTGSPTARDSAGRFCLDPAKVLPLAEVIANVPDHSSVGFTGEGVLEVNVNGIITILPAADQRRTKGERPVRLIGSDATAFRAVLDPIFLKLFKKVPDDGLLSQIVALCDGGQPEMLAARIEEKIAKGAYKDSGLVFELAKDVGAAWRATAAQRAAAEAKAAADCPDCDGSGRDNLFPQDDCASCAGTGQRSTH